VLAELSHIVAHGNVVCAYQKLTWAVQHLQAQSKEMAAEGAMAALMLITNVGVPVTCLLLTCGTSRQKPDEGSGSHVCLHCKCRIWCHAALECMLCYVML
jgi:hypothetical protein